MAAKIIEFPDAENATEGDGTVFQITATVLESDPPIWRRLLVPGQIDFEMLAEHLIIAFNWTGYHSYYFENGDDLYEDSQLIEQGSSLPDDGKNHYDASEKLLGDVLLPGEALEFVYDLGDCWSIAVEVEKEFLIDAMPYQFLPVCLDGARRAPVEDSGGMGGYENLCRVVANPDDPEYETMREWFADEVGEEFDPEFFVAFDLNSAYAYEMIDSLEDELLPNDPAELKQLCKMLMADKMALTAAFFAEQTSEDDEDEDDDWD